MANQNRIRARSIEFAVGFKDQFVVGKTPPCSQSEWLAEIHPLSLNLHGTGAHSSSLKLASAGQETAAIAQNLRLPTPFAIGRSARPGPRAAGLV